MAKDVLAGSMRGENMKILLLDDDRGLLYALQRMLKMHNHDVECCTCAHEAVSRIDTTAYDFVFVDYKMPETDGLWFMNNVNLQRGTKVILMTAFLHRDVIKRMFELGVSSYLIKPFDEDDILRHLSFHTGSMTMASTAVNPAAQPHPVART